MQVRVTPLSTAPAASRPSGLDKVVAALLLAAALVYLIPFVARGWIPHDEGMLGQSADRVLHGALPHVDYEEAYTGGLSWLYALVFRIGGVDLVNIRWLLFAGALVAAATIYTLVRRWLRPIPAAIATWIAIAWSFPNYFAGLPSWWLLIGNLIALWTLARYIETDRASDLALTGLAAGLTIAVKQTGVYLMVAIALTLAYREGGRLKAGAGVGAALLRGCLSFAAIAFAALLLGSRIRDAEGLYLFLPAAACAIVAILPQRAVAPDPGGRSWLPAISLLTIAAFVPIAIVLAPYAAHNEVAAFFRGAFVLPQRRLMSASMPMPSGWWMLSGMPLLALVMAQSPTGVPRLMPDFVRGPSIRHAAVVVTWCGAILLPLSALWYVTAYQALWQSTRAFAALIVLGACWRLATGAVQDRLQKQLLYASSAVLAWTSLNQFPFAAPIYFCYTAPLAIVVAVAMTAGASVSWSGPLTAWAASLLIFAFATTNRTDVHALGAAHVPAGFDTPLQLPRAHLRVTRDDAAVYQRLIAAIGLRLRGGLLMAGPDCPEVYFLAGLTSPSGALFDFLSASTDDEAARSWLDAQVVVVNHEPAFSPMPSEALQARLRGEFPNGEQIGRFEIRWR